jgi:DNA repair exonuclease SbcCD ATPase subunit
MRIKSVTLRNYRVHVNSTVQFNPERTLIGGPNEAGKSTLVEAIHRALFLKAKGNTEYHRAMESTLTADHPEVELTFEADGIEHRLKKRFWGNGNTVLASANAAALSGDEAENALNRLLGMESGASGKAMLSQWAHLWVWQGKAGDDPSIHAAAHHSSLLRQLQGEGVNAALQSVLDSKVAAQFAEAAATIYTQGGRAKAGSELERAESAVTQAEGEWNRAKEGLQKLETAVADVEAATRNLPLVQASLAGLERNQEALEEKAAELTRQRQMETEQSHAAESAKQRHNSLKAAEETICNTRAAILQLHAELDPKQSRLDEMERSLERAKRAKESAEKAYRAAADKVRGTRLRRDLTAGCLRSFELAEQYDKLVEKQKKVTKHRGELEKAETNLAQVPHVTRNKLNKLRELETEWTSARSALQAMAAGLEVLASGQPVRLGDRPVSVGEVVTVTEAAELHIGDTTRLRISPGGGSTLAEAREAEADALKNLREQLDALALKSLQEATDAFARREEIQERIKVTNAALEGLGAETLNEELSKAHRDLVAAKAEVERLAAQLPEVAIPESKDKAQALAKELRALLADSDNAEFEAKAERDVTDKKFGADEARCTKDRTEIEKERQKLTGLEGQFEFLIRTHGADSSRALGLDRAKLDEAEAARVLQATRSTIAALQPELIEGDRQRVNRAMKEKSKERDELRAKLAGAEARLRSDGSEDPAAASSSAEARVSSAREYRDSVQRRSAAIAELDKLFREELRSLAEQFTQPLADKISGYLQCLFGASTRAQVTLENSQFTGLRLSRGGETFAFDTLSGGAKEQLAAAVRLAMAEVLAADHGGCLPVVFDDAFAYSDPERVTQLQRMLDLAASRGLQIIVLTCSPADYDALGASRVILPLEQPAGNRQQVPPATAAGAAKGDRQQDGPGRQSAEARLGEEASASEMDGMQAEFLASLRELGGRSGNQALRDRLGWNEDTYNRVKEQLIAGGTVISGRGRGGSIALADVEHQD